MANTGLRSRMLVLTVCLLLLCLPACQSAPPEATPAPQPTLAPPPEVASTPVPPQPTSSPEPLSTEPAATATVAAGTAIVLVDNNDAGFAIEAGEWGHCFKGDCGGICWAQDFVYAEPACTNCRARFTFEVPAAGDYDVWTWWPWGDDRATDTRFTLEYSGGPLELPVDQHNSGDGWFWLASLHYEAGELASIVVQASGTGYANADAVALTPAGSGAPGGEASVSRPSAGEAPAVQYFYAEPSTMPGCYYLHWDVSAATAVWLDGDTVENPASAEVCPTENRDYVLRAENAAGSAEQVLAVEAGGGPPAESATPTPVARLTPTEPLPAGPSGYRRIIFLHHSCGANLIEQGGVRARFTALGFEFYDHGYNGDGLVLADGTWTGRNWDVPDDNTNPDGYAAIFAQPLHSPPDNTFSHLLEFDVILFKSCFPVSNIGSDEQLAEYKDYYRSIRARMDQYPDKVFVVVTQPPQVPANTDPQEAARARAFTRWLSSEEFLGGHPNIFTFDFFGLLADPGTNMLRGAYTGDPSDAHPNEKANQTIAPLFVEFVSQAVQAYLAR